MEEDYYITLSAQMGDQLSSKVIAPHLIQLNTLLDKYCNKEYSTHLDQFSLVLRVDGELWFWDTEGCGNLRLYKKSRYITLDIGMPRNKWEGKFPKDIRLFLLSNLEEALHLIVKRLKKEKIDLDEKLLLEDFNNLKKEYLIGI